MKIQFTAYGNVQPMLRARVFVDKRTGKVRAANPAKCTDWKNTIRLQALTHRPQKLMDGPLALEMVFYLLRPQSKPKREIYPRWKPDFDNLTKAVTDALEGVFYTNDSRIVMVNIRKEYGDPPRVEIEIKELI